MSRVSSEETPSRSRKNFTIAKNIGRALNTKTRVITRRARQSCFDYRISSLPQPIVKQRRVKRTSVFLVSSRIASTLREFQRIISSEVRALDDRPVSTRSVCTFREKRNGALCRRTRRRNATLNRTRNSIGTVSCRQFARSRPWPLLHSKRLAILYRDTIRSVLRIAWKGTTQK